MIVARGVTKSFGEVRAVDGLDLVVGGGTVYGLLGPNGAGKTTTIRLLLGLLRPDSGTLALGGVDVRSEPDRARRLVGYVPENVVLYPLFSALENLDYFSRLAGFDYGEGELRLLLEHAGLERSAHERRVETFSKGMRQRVGVAIALGKQARALLLDEPASGLDPKASHELGRLVARLASEGLAILMATHDLFRARDACGRVGIMRRGALVRELDAGEVTAQQLEAVYLDAMDDAPATVGS